MVIVLAALDASALCFIVATIRAEPNPAYELLFKGKKPDAAAAGSGSSGGGGWFGGSKKKAQVRGNTSSNARSDYALPLSCRSICVRLSLSR